MEPTRPAAVNRVQDRLEELAGRLISRPLVRQANLVLLAGCKSLLTRSGSSQPLIASVAAIRRRKPNEIVEAYMAYTGHQGQRTMQTVGETALFKA